MVNIWHGPFGGGGGGVKIFDLNIIGSFRENQDFRSVGYEDFVDVFRDIHRITGTIYGGQFCASSSGQCTEWDYFLVVGVAKIPYLLGVCLIFLIFFGG